MRPAIYRDRGYIASRIEATGSQRADELLANVALHGLKLCCEKLAAADAMLLASRTPRFARSAHHVDDDRLIWSARAMIVANADR